MPAETDKARIDLPGMSENILIAPRANQTPPTLRQETSRLGRFWCWLWFGHDGIPDRRSVRECGRCGAVQCGGD